MKKTGVLERTRKKHLHKSTETLAPAHAFQNRATPSCPSHTLTNAQSGNCVFRLLGTNFGCPALYKEPLQGQNYLSIYLSTDPSIHLSIYLSIYTTTTTTTHPSIYLPIHPPTYPLIHPSIHLSTYLSIYPSIHPPTQQTHPPNIHK